MKPRTYGFFDRNLLGRKGLLQVIKYLESLECTKEVIDVSLNKEYQQKGIDILHILERKLEVKTNSWAKQTGNFFIETWSNKERNVKGWFYTSQAEYILYLVNSALYILPLEKIRQLDLNQYQEKATQTPTKEGAYTTVGRLVPIKDVLAKFNVERVILN